MPIFNAFWLPAGCDVAFETRDVEMGEQTVRFPVTTPEVVAQVAAFLKTQQRAVLAGRSVDSIATALDRAAARWLEPDYVESTGAISAIASLTGFSAPMVAHAIHCEQRSSRLPDMLATLDGELGDRRVLDGFIDSPKGRTMAVGPELVGGVFSANIPALPHLTIMRALLVKAACLGRVSRDEPLYLPLYCRTIEELDPELASCLAVLWWPSDDHVVEAAFLGGIDHLIAYGGDATLSAIRSRAPERLRATWHGHRMGFAVVGRDALAGDLEFLCDRLAYDFTVFDQHACLAPQAVYVEDHPGVSAERFGRLLHKAMERWAVKLPARTLSVEEATRLRSAVDDAQLSEAMGLSETRVLSGDAISGVVMVAADGVLAPTPLNRFVRVVPVPTLDDVFAHLEPVGRHLQCAAVAGVTDAFRRRLVRTGVTRLCPPGAMGTPSMLWHHDGWACLSQLVRWCDEEIIRPGIE